MEGDVQGQPFDFKMDVPSSTRKTVNTCVLTDLK